MATNSLSSDQKHDPLTLLNSEKSFNGKVFYSVFSSVVQNANFAARVNTIEKRERVQTEFWIHCLSTAYRLSI